MPSSAQPGNVDASVPLVCRSFEGLGFKSLPCSGRSPVLAEAPSEAEGEVEGAEILTFPVSENHKKLLSALVSAALNIGGPPAHSSSFRRHPIVLPLVPAHAARPPVFRRRAFAVFTSSSNTMSFDRQLGQRTATSF